MNCWGIRIYFTKSRFSLNGGYIVYMELLSGHEKIITKSGISPNAGTLNRGFTVLGLWTSSKNTQRVTHHFRHTSFFKAFALLFLCFV
jgi:hypothetical protein